MLRLWITEFSDLGGIADVVGHDAYRAPGDPRVIVDLGSHIGTSVRLFRARYPGAEIHAVEPDPISLHGLRLNTAGDPRIHVHPVAVGGRTGRARFHQSRRGWGSSLRGDRDAFGGRWIDVEVVALPDLLARAGVEHADLIKIDVEGAEWQLFAGTSLAAYADAVVGELHDTGEHRLPADFSPGLDGLRVRFGEPPDPDLFVAVKEAG